MLKRIGRYEVQAELGRGGFGRVFRAYDPTVDRPVAIKTLIADGEPDLLTRFRNEAAATGKLRHPNIVIIYDFGEHDGVPYIVMELLDGEDLDNIINGQHHLTLLKKLNILRQVSAGLQHAHANGIVHRDVKPANIMVLRNGTVKIMDFGIALLTHASASRITPKGSLIGAVPYMSPEQFNGAASDTLTDIFAYGVTSYELLTGTHPFWGSKSGELMFNIMTKMPAPIRALNPECPEALGNMVLKMLEKDRAKRYENFDDVQVDLELIISDMRAGCVLQLLRRAHGMIASGESETAQVAVRQILELDPGNRTARELREHIQRLQKDKLSRLRVAELVDEGRQHLAARQSNEAIQEFESALALNQSDPDLPALISRERAGRDESQSPEKLVEHAREALNQNDLAAAEKNTADALALDPASMEAQSEAERDVVRQETLECPVDSGQQLQAAFDHHSAAETTTRPSDLPVAPIPGAPTRWSAHLGVATVRLRFMFAAEIVLVCGAIGLMYRMSSDVTPGSLRPEGRTLPLQQPVTVRHEDRINPRARAIYALHEGKRLDKEGNYKDAIAAFTHAIELQPQWAEGYFQRADTYRRFQLSAQAVPDLRKAITLDPAHAGAYFSLGAALVNMKPPQYAEALEAYSKAIELKPSFAYAWNGRAFVRLKTLHFQAALSDANAALRLDPKYTNGYATRSLIRKALGDLAGAQADRVRAKLNQSH